MSNIVIVGAGPAGIAAAATAGEAIILDDNPTVGGQIWRGGHSNEWFERLSRSPAKVITSTRVIAADATRQTLLVERNGQAESLSYSKLILATGARELFLPFPGWTLPNVMGVGGLQALVKCGLPIKDKRIIVAGSGPLLLAVAAYLQKCGAVVPLIAEQASLKSLTKFVVSLGAHPAKIWQAIHLRPNRYLSSCWIEAALGTSRVERVRLRQDARVWEEPCDYVANAYGFVPNTELAALLGCNIENGAVKVNASQLTSVPNIYCAGETTGIGGVDTALLEGQIAAGAPGLQSKLRKAKSFARLLNQTFRLRPELRSLAQPDTIVCRCEDVTLAALHNANSWRSAKLHERCGMGPCQGRICGPAVKFMLGWEPASIRPPLFPTRLENLLQESSLK